MKIKDSLDLGGNLLQNFCIDNYSDIDNANRGKGRTIFYTGNDVERKDHVIVFDGTSFKALAYMEDVADNAAFKALQDDVALLKGDVDTDAIISNMKEVSAFLEGFAEDASLMDYLNTELGKKLDLTGGTLTGSLAVSSGTISSLRTSTRRAVFYKNASESVDSGTYIVDVSDSGDAVLKLTYNDLTWKGNSILTSAGGTMTGNVNYCVPSKQYWAAGLTYSDSSNNIIAQIGAYSNNSSTIDRLYLGFGAGPWNGANALLIRKDSITYNNYDILHSGNIGEYNAGGIANLGSPTTDTFADYIAKYAKGANVVINESGAAIGNIGKYESVFNVGTWSGRFGRFIFSVGTNPTLCFQTGNDSGNGWGNKKTIAFTDSTVDAANRLVANSGDVVTLDSNKNAYFAGRIYIENNQRLMGYGTDKKEYILTRITSGNDIIFGDTALPTYVRGSQISFTYGSTTAMLINSSGNVTIGNTDLAGTDVKLYVDGKVKVSNRLILGDNDDFGIWKGSVFSSSMSNNDIAIYGESKIILHGGNVLIGTTDDKGANSPLFVAGNSANLITIKRTHDYYGAYIEYIAANADVKQWRVGVNESKCFVFENYNTGNNAVYAMLINSSGNVTIGNRDHASSDYKLFVSGNSVFLDSSRRSISTDKISSSAIVEITAMNKGNDGLYIGQLANSTVWLQSAYGGSDTNPSSNHTYPLSLQPLGGNVLIGTTTELKSGSKLQVKGDLYVEGNIIADGEVSAGGAAEESGSSSGGGGGAFYSCTIPVGTKSINVVHGLETEDIVVSLYEKNATNGKWNMAYTDIEIEDANTIEVSFGFATDVEHKVVISGAVA